jgi:hypothetical protein
VLEGTAKSKSSAHLAEAIMDLIYVRYVAHGHTPKRVIADSEPSLVASTALFGTHHVVISFVDPGQKAQRIERHIGSLDSLRRAVLGSLAFWVPEIHMPYCRRWVADCRNGLVNSRSAPLTSDLIVTGVRRQPHYKYPNISFGWVCMVQQHDVKRNRIAGESGQHKVVVDVAELGVCLGYTPSTPGDFDFVLANGSIVARKVFQPVQVHPFDWRRKVVYQAEIQTVGSKLQSSYDAPILPDLTSVVLPDVPKRDIAIPHFSNTDLDSFVVPPSVLPYEPSTVPPPAQSTPSELVRSSAPEHIPVSEVNAFTPLSPARDLLSDAAVVPVTPLPISFTVDDRNVRQNRSATSGRVLPPGLWAGAAKVASEIAADFPSSDCDWVVPKKYTSVLQAQSVFGQSDLLSDPLMKLLLSMDLTSAPRPIVSARIMRNRNHQRSKVASRLAKAQSDALKSADNALLDDIISALSTCRVVLPPDADIAFAAAAVLISEERERQTAWFNTMQSDEFDLDAVNRSEDAPSVFVSRASLSDLRPTVISTCKEVSLYKATQSISMQKLSIACDVEILKQQTLKCLGAVIFREVDIPDSALIVSAHVLFKEKDDGRFTCRVAARGDTLPVLPGQVNFASVCSDSDKMFCLAAMQAHCQQRN